jgi:hypothetical protein
LIGDQFLASVGRSTDSGFTQPEVLANLCCRQAQIPNRPVSQNTTGVYPNGLFPGDNHLVFFNVENCCNLFGNFYQRSAIAGCGALLQNRAESFNKSVSISIVFKNILSLDTPAYDVMQGTRRIYSGLTWHVTLLPQANEKRNA